MPFEIKPVDRTTFEAIWTPAVRAQLDEFIYGTDHWFDDMDIRPNLWVIDETTQTTLIRVGMANKFDAADCYALVQRNEFALIRNVSWGTYTIAAYSTGFSKRMDEAEELVTKALLVGGQRLDGNPWPEKKDPNRSIPYVNFVEYVAPKIGE